MQTLSLRGFFFFFFFCLGTMKKGFRRGGRLWLGIDGCHLKGNHGRVLLSAIAIDGNQRMFPIAFAIVEVECLNCWKFFFKLASWGIGFDS